MELTFEHGILRQPRPSDADRIAAICQDPAIQRFTRVPIPYALSDAQDFIALTNERWSSGRPATLVAVVDGTIVANIGFVHDDAEDRWGELGYWTAPEARRRGITTAGVRRLCSWAFHETALQRLELQTAGDNAGSEAVAHHVGFQREGVRRSAAVLRATEEEPEQRVDMTMWGLLPAELSGNV